MEQQTRTSGGWEVLEVGVTTRRADQKVNRQKEDRNVSWQKLWAGRSDQVVERTGLVQVEGKERHAYIVSGEKPNWKAEKLTVNK